MDKMTEAQFMGMLVVALISLFALFKAVAKPLIKGLTELTKSITTLDASVNRLQSDVANIKSDIEKETEHSSQSRKRIWAHNDEQDKKLENHEKRIWHLELQNKEVNHENQLESKTEK